MEARLFCVFLEHSLLVSLTICNVTLACDDIQNRAHKLILDEVSHFININFNLAYLESKKEFLLARACGVPAVGVRAVDCWQ